MRHSLTSNMSGDQNHNGDQVLTVTLMSFVSVEFNGNELKSPEYHNQLRLHQNLLSCSLYRQRDYSQLPHTIVAAGKSQLLISSSRGSMQFWQAS